MLVDVLLLAAVKQELVSAEVEQQIREKNKQRARNSLTHQVQVAPLHPGRCCCCTMDSFQKPPDKVFLIAHFSAWRSSRAMRIALSGTHMLAGSNGTKPLAPPCVPNPRRVINNPRPGRAPRSGSIWCARENGRKRELKSRNTFWCAA